MKTRQVSVQVTDHALVRFLEREHGVDLAPLRALLAEQVRSAAALKASSVCVGRVRFVLADMDLFETSAGVEVQAVAVTTALRRSQDSRRRDEGPARP